MVIVKRFLILVVIALLAIFAFQNQESLLRVVDIKIFKYQASMYMGFWLILSFVCGAGIFLIIDLPRALSQKRELRRKSQELARLQFELGRYQNAAAVAGQTPPGPILPNPDFEKRLL